MDTATQTFHRLRPRLQSIAYRMLGSAADAEEVVQDTWLRWNEAAHATLDSADAWLVTVATRLSIDRLRASKVQREHYVGTWLPEPVLTESAAGPEETLERADQISLAFLMLLERLAPEARAAFLLREVFDADYPELAQIVGKSEAACRQMVHRAKLQLRDERPRFTVSRDAHLRLLTRFADALRQGDFASMTSMLADDVELIGDGGGKVPSFGKPLVGGRRVAQLYYAVGRRAGEGLRVEVAEINGQWGMLRFIDGVIESAQWFETDGERIVRIHSQRNPDKLASLVTNPSPGSSLQR
jgi:RNA polymerase sigma-70 factor (TIGR02957 family)